MSNNPLKYPIKLLFRKEREFCCSIYDITGFCPKNSAYYHLALTTPSAFANQHKKRQVPEGITNERMEFLGDAILGNYVAIYVYDRYRNKDEGFLTDMRSRFVKRKSLGYLCNEIGLAKLINKSSLEHRFHNSYVTGNVVEAFICAVYLDLGMKKCRKFIEEKLIRPYFDKMANFDPDYKTIFMQQCQKYRLDAQFLTEQSGTEHEPVFNTTIVLDGHEIGKGMGFTKKESHQKACSQAIKYVKSHIE